MISTTAKCPYVNAYAPWECERHSESLTEMVEINCQSADNTECLAAANRDAVWVSIRSSALHYTAHKDTVPMLHGSSVEVLSVCVCLSVRQHLPNHTGALCQCFCAFCLWP